MQTKSNHAMEILIEFKEHIKCWHERETLC